MRALALAAAGGAAMLAGCTVGPDYAGPPPVAGIGASDARFVRAGDGAVAEAPAAAAWWTAFGDPLLDRLEADALAHSPTIAEAQGRIDEARARIGGARAQGLPLIAGTATYAHVRLPGSGLGTAQDAATDEDGGNDLDPGAGGGDDDSSGFEFYNIGAQASWEPDLFGGGRRSVEQARATLGQRYAELADAQVALSAQVAQSYVDLRAAEARLGIAQASSAAQARMLALTRQRYAGGTASRLEVDRLLTAQEAADADAVPLTAQVAIYRDALAVLTGQAPGALDVALADPRPVPLPPAQVAVGDPAGLVARRPDIRAAERALAAGTANIGVQAAKRLPQLSFTGILGLGGPDIGDLVDPGSLATVALPMLRWGFLDFGQTAAQVDVARAQADQAQARYARTVLSALQAVEDSLARFGATRRQLAGLLRAEAAARDAAGLQAQRYRAGTATLIDQLDGERQALARTDAVAQAKAQLAIDFIAVNRELGLGWTGPVPAQTASGEEAR